jgi:hypothetical protein
MLEVILSHLITVVNSCFCLNRQCVPTFGVVEQSEELFSKTLIPFPVFDVIQCNKHNLSKITLYFFLFLQF